MTASNHKKVFKQLKTKPHKLKKFIKHNSPKNRSCGKSLKKCNRCGSISGHISKYTLGLCRQCFREIATNIDFKKFS